MENQTETDKRFSLLELDDADLALESPENYAPELPELPEIEPAKFSVNRSADLVAGAAASGHGVLIGWSGAGESTIAAVTKAVAAAGLAPELAPEPRQARTHAGNAVSKLNGSGYIARVERGAGETDYAARWYVGEVVAVAGEAGEDFGKVALVVTLSKDGALTTDGAADLAESVRAEFDRTTGAQVLKPAAVTAWLSGVLKTQFSAVKFGGNWYCPATHAQAAESLCAAVAADWGKDWLLPALPIATSDQLRQGLARGLVGEVAEIRQGVASAQALAESRGKALGHRAATNALVRLEDVAARAQAYQAVMGEETIAIVIDAARTMIAYLRNFADAVAVRGALIWDEIAGDIDSAGEEVPQSWLDYRDQWIENFDGSAAEGSREFAAIFGGAR